MKQQFTLGAILCALSLYTYAAETLDEVVVTASRIEQPLSQTLTSTSVITQEDIKNSQATDVPSILRSIAGVEISQNGGTGKLSSLFMRGSNDTQTLVLLDGVRIGSITTGTTSIEHLMLDQIERIEVVRGNVSSLYGSEAIGGVVQIFTKQAQQASAINASIGAGSYGTAKSSAGLSGSSDATRYNLQVSRVVTAGYSAIDSNIAPAANPDPDGYHNSSVSANIKHIFNADHNLSASAFNSEGSTQYDRAYGSATDTHHSAFRISKFTATAEDRLHENWLSLLKLSQGTDKSQNYLNSAPATPGSLYTTTNRQLSWQNNLQLGNNKQMIIGAEHLTQAVETDLQPQYNQDERKIRTLFAGYSGNYDQHQLQLNARQDNYSDFGYANTGLIGYGYNIDEAWRITANTSSAFKAPTFNDMFYPFTDYGFGYSYQGNPNLLPERSLGRELGLHYAVDNQRVDVVYFDNRINDLITSNGLPASTMINLNEARIDGIETSYKGKISEIDLKLAVTAQNPRNVATGAALIRRAKLFSNVTAMYQFAEWKLVGEWQYTDQREDYDVNTFSRIKLDSYNLFNAVAHYRVSKQINLSMRVDNLFNQGYMLSHGYNTAGRSYFVNLAYQQ